MKNVLFLQDNSTMRSVINFEQCSLSDIKIRYEKVYREDIPYRLVQLLRRISKITATLSLGKWSKALDRFDYLMVMESDVSLNALRAINELGLSKNVILYFLNSINDQNIVLLDYAKASGVIVATYNIADSRKYEINYVNQCWNERLAQSIKNSQIDNDVFFVGRAKDRYDSIINIKNIVEDCDVRSKFVIVSENGEDYTQREELPYLKCLEKMSKSKCIVDIVGISNSGMTWRPLEALFLERKLITNYKEIVEYDIYRENKENIFVVGRDHIKELKKFIESPYIENNFDKSKYDVEGWIKLLCDLHM